MRSLRDMTSDDLRDLRRAASEAIDAIAWFDIWVRGVVGLRQCEVQFSAAADALRKVDAETRRRKERDVN